MGLCLTLMPSGQPCLTISSMFFCPSFQGGSNFLIKTEFFIWGTWLISRSKVLLLVFLTVLDHLTWVSSGHEYSSSDYLICVEVVCSRPSVRPLKNLYSSIYTFFSLLCLMFLKLRERLRSVNCPCEGRWRSFIPLIMFTQGWPCTSQQRWIIIYPCGEPRCLRCRVYEVTSRSDQRGQQGLYCVPKHSGFMSGLSKLS